MVMKNFQLKKYTVLGYGHVKKLEILALWFHFDWGS